MRERERERERECHNAEHHGKADGNVLPPNQGGYRVHEKPPGKTQPDSHTMSTKDSRGRNKVWPWRSIWKMRTNNAIQTADGTPCAIQRQLDAHKMARSRTPGKKGCHATWKLDLHAPTTGNGSSTRLPLSPVLYNIYTKELADLNINGLSLVLTLADDGLIYKTARDIHTAVTAFREQLEKVSHWCQETESEINLSKAHALWFTLNNKAVGQAMPVVSFNGEVKERTNSLRYIGSHFD